MFFYCFLLHAIKLGYTVHANFICVSAMSLYLEIIGRINRVNFYIAFILFVSMMNYMDLQPEGIFYFAQTESESEIIQFQCQPFFILIECKKYCIKLNGRESEIIVGINC